MYFKKTTTCLLAIATLLCVGTFSSCINNTSKNGLGFTGVLTDSTAKQLQNKCHFMPKDTIAVWTERYQNYKKTAAPDSTNMANFYMDSCSFNNSIVRAIITNDSCMGLRVINGMDEKNKVHIILVGIKPDYSTLYIKKPANCGVTKEKNGRPTDEEGGAEWGDMP